MVGSSIWLRLDTGFLVLRLRVDVAESLATDIGRYLYARSIVLGNMPSYDGIMQIQGIGETLTILRLNCRSRDWVEFLITSLADAVNFLETDILCLRNCGRR